MSISPISNAGIFPTAASSASGAQSNWQNIMSSVAGTLGLSPSALQQQLQSGQSLSSIASSQGVSQQSLVQSISSALTQNGSTATGSSLQQIATNIANRTHHGGGHHHQHGGGGAGDALLQALDGSSSTDGSSATSTSTSSGTTTSATTAATAQSFASVLAGVDPATAVQAQNDTALLQSLSGSSSSSSEASLANDAAYSEIWQGLNTYA